MKVSSVNFYKDIKPFLETERIVNESYYHDLPEDWFVISVRVIDVKKAIEEDRYKDANVLVVSSVVAVKNACGQVEVPYIFGGDTAKIFIPSEKIEKVKNNLASTKMKARVAFELVLKIDIIPVHEFYKKNKNILIAKLKLSESASMAMVKGAGIGLLKEIVDTSNAFEFNLSSLVEEAHNGLECRWSKIKSKNGEIMAIIIQSRSADLSVYMDTLVEIKKITVNLNLLSLEQLTIKWPPQHYFKEIQMKFSGFKKYLVFL